MLCPKNRVDDRAMSMLCDGRVNGSTHMDNIEIHLLKIKDQQTITYVHTFEIRFLLLQVLATSSAKDTTTSGRSVNTILAYSAALRLRFPPLVSILLVDMNVCFSKEGIISMVVVCYASDNIEYDLRTPALYNAPLLITKDANIIEKFKV